eukprot:GHVU01148971.1.p1 GENE.GHVU01148971.1~~GHVU01148971.1.p1  ORF type:complete len:139 (+),score=28.35 GHVU01148971.1:619-1035(+)
MTKYKQIRNIRMSGRRVEPRCMPCMMTEEDIREHFVPPEEVLNPPPTMKETPTASFAIATPAREDAIAAAVRSYNQVDEGIKAGEIRLPPTVVAVKKDVLADMEKELRKPLPNLVAAFDKRLESRQIAPTAAKPPTTK